jgi:hypothetical protein
MREIMITQCGDRALHEQLTCSTNSANSLSSAAVVTLIKNAYSEETTETCVLHSFQYRTL